MWDFMQTMKSKVTECIIGMMVEYSKDGGHTTNNAGQENILLPMVKIS